MTLFAIQQHSLTALEWIRQTLMHLYNEFQERSLHLIYKNLFSIKQYQFPPKIGLNLFKESRRSSPLSVCRRLRLYIYPRRPQVMVECDRE